jgi:regulator of sigma E protease
MIYILAFAWLFGMLVFFHELGHFLVAKLSGVKVLTFSLGFGPKLIGKQIGETEYRISALPLGGYVKLYGENPQEKVAKKEEKRAMRHQPLRNRMAITVAGSLANFILGIFLFTIVYSVGTHELAPVVGEIMDGSPAQEAGVRSGDVIVKIDDKAITLWNDIPLVVHESEGKELQLTLKRGEDTINTTVTPRVATAQNIFGKKTQTYQLGIYQSGQLVLYKEPIYKAFGNSFYRAWFIMKTTVIAIVKMIQGTVSAEENVGGPYTIAKMAGKTAQLGFSKLVLLTAIVSVSVGLINLFPIPVLDGGHLFVLAVEGIRRRPLTNRQTQIIWQIGWLMIMLLIAFVLYIEFKREVIPDIMKLFQQGTQ